MTNEDEESGDNENYIDLSLIYNFIIEVFLPIFYFLS